MLFGCERMGCLSSEDVVIEFSNFFMNACVLDAGFYGNKYTWCKREHDLDTKWATV